MRRHLFASTLGLLAGAAWAQEPSEPPERQRVEIVGSRVPRLAAETAVPVQIISREEIARSGVVDVEELLDRVTANFGGQHEAMGLGDADTPGLSAASLRGFGAGETLVLLNGRRLANYAFTSTAGPGVDLHVIPLSAIQRVEILKDGASALYGSDAIAGVINFVTRQDYAGAEADLGRSVTERGGGGRGHVSLTGGVGDAGRDGYNLLAVLDVREQQPLRALQRSFASTAYRPELGLVATSPMSWPANIDLAPPGQRPKFVNPDAPQCTPQTVFRRNGCMFDAARFMTLVAPSRQVDGLARGTWRLTDAAEAYAEVLAADSRVLYASSPSPGFPSAAAPDARFVLSPTSPYYPANLGLAGDIVLDYRTLPLGARRSEVNSDNLRLLAGLRLRLAEWDLDGAASANESHAIERYLSGFADAARLGAAFATGLLNPFGASGPQGDALLAATQVSGKSRDSVGRTHSADLRATRELGHAAGGPIALALGAEARHESLRDTQEPLAREIVSSVPSAPKHGARNVEAGFVEVVTPLLPGLEVQTAARIDHYSDFGTAFDPKLAIRLQPRADWLLRASIGRGFRAPSLPELYTQQTSGTEEVLDDAGQPVADPVRCPATGLASDCQLFVHSIGGGNPDLRPQRSTQANVGIVLESAAGWQASLDWWRIEVHDIIGTLSFDDIVADIPRYDGRNIVRGPVDPNHPGLPGPIVEVLTIAQNLGDWRVDGADLSFSLKPVATALGRTSAQFDATCVRRARQAIFEGNVVNLVGRLVPRCQYLASAHVERGAWSATLSQRFRQGYVDQNPLPDGATRRVGSYRMWDGQLAFAWSRDVQGTLGVHNLFDRAPPFTNSRAQFQVGYDPAYADPLGRTWTLGLHAAWR